MTNKEAIKEIEKLHPIYLFLSKHYSEKGAEDTADKIRIKFDALGMALIAMRHIEAISE